MRCLCKHIAVSVNTHYQDRIIITWFIIRKHSQNSNYFNGKVNENHVLLFKCASETHRSPPFKYSRKLPYVVFRIHLRSVLSSVYLQPTSRERHKLYLPTSAPWCSSSMRVGLANFRPCIRFHFPCAATAIAYAVSAFSFAIGTLFFIAVIFVLLFQMPWHVTY